MKKLLFFAAVASVMLTACSSGNEEAKVTDSSPLRLSTQNITGLTRAGQSVQLSQFANGQNVGIFLVEDNAGTPVTSGTNVTTYTQPLPYEADGNGALANTQYWPTDGNGLHIWGVYPLAAATTAAAYNATNVSFSVQANQSSDANYMASDLMTGKPASNPVARTTSAVPLTFTHLLTKIDVNLTAGDGFAASDMNNAVVSILNTKPTTTFSVQSTDVAVADVAVAPIVAGTGVATSAIIVPQTVAASTDFIKVAIGGGEYIYKLPATPTTGTVFAAKTKYTYNIQVNKTGLILTSTTITGWENGGSTPGTAELQ